MMYMSENKMVVADALARIDSVLEAAPMQVQAVPPVSYTHLEKSPHSRVSSRYESRSFGLPCSSRSCFPVNALCW